MMSQSMPHLNRRRDKPILSCLFCRGRKLRCDRQSPCSACVRYGKAAECTYSSSEQERKDAIDYRPHVRSSQQARQRIARLESLVTEMREMVQSSHQPSNNIASSSPSDAPVHPGPPPTLPDGNVEDTMGTLSLTENQAVYFGSSHWVTILEDIRCLKDELSEDYSSDSPANQGTMPLDAVLMHGPSPVRISLLTNRATCLPREQILAMIPSRKAADRLVSHYFNAFDMAPFMIRRNKFFAEYASFWSNPSATPIIWVALLFSIMAMSLFLQQPDAGDDAAAVESQDKLEIYRTLTIHCLIAGDFLRPTRYTMETLTIHFGLEQNVNVDADISNWILIGVVIRIAIRMGLHRDPSHWPNIRPLQAELRRRLWIILYQMDFFTSSQVGLPRTIKDSQCDVRPPTHLFEDDICPEDDEIPPARLITESTPLLRVIERNAIIKVAAEIYDTTEGAPLPPATIAVLGAKLDKAIDTMSAGSKYMPLETSIVENPSTIMQQMFLDILTQKALYLLHRRNFVKGTSVGEEESTKSNELCIKAALTILEHQRKLSEETQPGGLLFGIRWRVVSSLNHEFLQATMMLCFALSRFNDGDDGIPNAIALHRRDEILGALIIAQGLWEKNAQRSVEARKAAKAISTVLRQDSDNLSVANFTALNGFFEQMPGLATQDYIGNFDDGQNMALDPSFFVLDDNMAFGMDDFVTNMGT